MFAIRPIPYPFELLSSYLHRLAKANLLPRHAVQKAAGYGYNDGTGRVKNNLNTNSQPINFALLSGLVAREPRYLEGLTLSRYKKVLYKDEDLRSNWSRSNARWIKAATIAVCPPCLRDANYYRTYWKLWPVFACTKHRILLIDRCQKCKSQIYDIDPRSRVIHAVGQCWKCGFDFSTRASYAPCDAEGLRVQRKILGALHRKKALISCRSRLCAAEYFETFKALHKVISRLRESNKVSDVRSNYVMMRACHRILANWPEAFFRLLNEVCKVQGPESKTRNRVFGLTQSTHVLLSRRSPEVVRKAYRSWVKNRLMKGGGKQVQDLQLDPRLYPYSNVSFPPRKTSVSLHLDEKSWEALRGFFKFPPRHLGSGNFYRRAVGRARLFASAYKYKLAFGCRWSDVPAVRKKLIKSGGLYQRTGSLRKTGALKPVTKELLQQLKQEV